MQIAQEDDASNGYHMIDLNKLENDAQRLVAAAISAGADHCDVVVAHGQSLSINIREGKQENTDRSEGDGISLRVFCGKKLASISANQMDDIDALASRAVAMAKVSPEDPYQQLLEESQFIDQAAIQARIEALDLFDPFVPDAEFLSNYALACEEAGLAVQGVQKSMGASASWGISGFVLATSAGFSGNFKRSRFSGSAAMLAGEGTKMERDYDFASKVHLEDMESAQIIGKSAGERVVRRLNARQVETAGVPVVFDKRVSAGILACLMGAINGSSIARKTSFLRDEMGKSITGDNITIVDDPLIKRGAASRPFDGEGMACDAMNFVENGILQEWVLDGATARELNLKSNARSARSGSGTSPSSTNCYMQAGKDSAEAMISDIKSGLYLTETIGHGINMVSGDYSKGASGFWIENGEITYPVAEITIAGNLKDMFLNMVPADDLEFKYATNAPTLRIDGMTVGGK